MIKVLRKFLVLIISSFSLIVLINYQVKMEVKTNMNTLAILVEDAINSYGFVNENVKALLKKNSIEIKSDTEIKKSEKFEFSLEKDIFDYVKNRNVTYIQYYSFVCLVSSS